MTLVELEIKNELIPQEPLKYTLGVAARVTADLITQIHNINKVAMQKLQQQIADRKMFVMFEEKLGCDPLYDHLNSKNVLPLFIDFFKEATKNLNDLDANTIMRLLDREFTNVVQQEACERNQLILKIAEAEARAREAEDQFKNAQRVINGYIQNVKSLRTDIENQQTVLKEQVYQTLKFGARYHADVTIVKTNQEDPKLEDLDELSRYKMKCDSLGTHIHGIKVELEQMAQRQNVLLDKIEYLKQFENQVETMKQLCEERQKETDAAKKHLQEYITENDALQMRIMQQRAQLLEFEAVKQDMTNYEQRILKQTQDKFDGLYRQLRQREDTISNLNETIKEQIAEFEAREKNELDFRRTQTQKVADQQKEATKTLRLQQDQARELNQARQELVELRNKKAELQEQLAAFAEKDNTIFDLQKQLQAVMKQTELIAPLQAENAQKEEHMREKDQLIQQHQMQIQKLNQKCQQMNKQLSQANNKITELAANPSSSTNALEATAEDITEEINFVTETVAVQTDPDDTVAQLTDMKRRLSEADVTYEKIIQRLQVEQDETQHQNALLVDEIAGLKVALAEQTRWDTARGPEREPSSQTEYIYSEDVYSDYYSDEESFDPQQYTSETQRAAVSPDRPQRQTYTVSIPAPGPLLQPSQPVERQTVPQVNVPRRPTEPQVASPVRPNQQQLLQPDKEEGLRAPLEPSSSREEVPSEADRRPVVDIPRSERTNSIYTQPQQPEQHAVIAAQPTSVEGHPAAEVREPDVPTVHLQTGKPSDTIEAKGAHADAAPVTKKTTEKPAASESAPGPAPKEFEHVLVAIEPENAAPALDAGEKRNSVRSPRPDTGVLPKPIEAVEPRRGTEYQQSQPEHVEVCQAVAHTEEVPQQAEAKPGKEQREQTRHHSHSHERLQRRQERRAEIPVQSTQQPDKQQPDEPSKPTLQPVAQNPPKPTAEPAAVKTREGHRSRRQREPAVPKEEEPSPVELDSMPDLCSNPAMPEPKAPVTSRVTSHAPADRKSSSNGPRVQANSTSVQAVSEGGEMGTQTDQATGCKAVQAKPLAVLSKRELGAIQVQQIGKYKVFVDLDKEEQYNPADQQEAPSLLKLALQASKRPDAPVSQAKPRVVPSLLQVAEPPRPVLQLEELDQSLAQEQTPVLKELTETEIGGMDLERLRMQFWSERNDNVKLRYMLGRQREQAHFLQEQLRRLNDAMQAAQDRYVFQTRQTQIETELRVQDLQREDSRARQQLNGKISALEAEIARLRTANNALPEHHVDDHPEKPSGQHQPAQEVPAVVMKNTEPEKQMERSQKVNESVVGRSVVLTPSRPRVLTPARPKHPRPELQLNLAEAGDRLYSIAQEIRSRQIQKRSKQDATERAAALKAMATTRTLDPEIQAHYDRVESFAPEKSEEGGSTILKVLPKQLPPCETGLLRETALLQRARSQLGNRPVVESAYLGGGPSRRRADVERIKFLQ